MNNIVVAFPNAEKTNYIKKILAQSGYPVTAVATTGAKALSCMGELGIGIIICGYRFNDMMYSEIYEYMPEGFQMLLIASASGIMEKDVENLVSLSMPFRVYDLLQTVEMMDNSISRKKKRLQNKAQLHTDAEKEVLEEAKKMLMDRNGFSEAEAHRYIQKRSMDKRTGIIETAQLIVSFMRDI